METFNGKSRDGLLAIEVFHTRLEAKVMAEGWSEHYNTTGHILLFAKDHRTNSR